MNKRHTALAALAITASVALLAGCSSSGGSSSTSFSKDAKGTLNAWGFDNADEVGTSRLAYAKDQLKGVTIKIDQTPFDAQKFTTRVAGGNVPDVVQMDRQFVATYAAQGLIVPLDQCYSVHGVDPSKTYYKSVMDDVTYGGKYMGAMTTVLPAGTKTTTVGIYPGDNPVKVWQVQVRPADTKTSQQWLTVFDLSGTAAKVATASPVTVSQGGIVGVELLASDGNSVVVSSSGAAGTPLSGGIVYGVQPLSAYHVVTDLVPDTGYTVTTSANAGLRNVNISVGGTTMSSDKGVLSFYVTTDGTVQGNPPPPPTPVYVPVPISSLPVPGFPAPYKPGG